MLFRLFFLACFSWMAFRNSGPDEQAGSHPDKSSDNEIPLAEKYPHDLGIQKDPDVLYAEDFEGDTSDIFSRYTDVKNRQSIFPDADVPKGSRGRQSVRLTNGVGSHDGSHLYKMIQPGWDDSLYIRYYVKYPRVDSGYIHHSSVQIGGKYPALPYHQGQAGICGLGDRRFSVSYEPNREPEMDAYLYWGEMRSWNGGTSCYGNPLINGSPTMQKLRWDDWICVEIMIKLNDKPDARSGELRIWQDGVEVGHWGPGFPNGHWDKDHWYNHADGKPFEGFLWRTNPLLNFNYMRIEYYDSKGPKGEDHYVKFDHLVVARKYIGPIADRNRRK